MVHGVQHIYIEKCDESDPELCGVEIIEAKGLVVLVILCTSMTFFKIS
jgi:hypothetical protein